MQTKQRKEAGFIEWRQVFVVALLLITAVIMKSTFSEPLPVVVQADANANVVPGSMIAIVVAALGLVSVARRVSN